MSALVFDCDGVLADTERYGHLPAFNQTFERFGLPVRWDEDEYAVKLRVGGGKERMATLFDDPEFTKAAAIPPDPSERFRLLAEWHRAKTEAFQDLVAAGRLPGRPGVARIVGEALDAGWVVAVASTSAEPSVRAVLEHVVGMEDARRIPVFAGDVVPAKKPDPAIYAYTLDRLDLEPSETLVVEDSRNGLLAANRAGLRCVVTVNDYTRHESFDEAVLVVSGLGEPGGPPIEVLANRTPADVQGYLTLVDLDDCLRPTAGAGHPRRPNGATDEGGDA